MLIDFRYNLEEVFRVQFDGASRLSKADCLTFVVFCPGRFYSVIPIKAEEPAQPAPQCSRTNLFGPLIGGFGRFSAMAIAELFDFPRLGSPIGLLGCCEPCPHSFRCKASRMPGKLVKAVA